MVVSKKSYTFATYFPFTMLTHRSISEIFPPYYPLPDEEDIARKCRAHFSASQMINDLTRWIEREQCPYMREAYAETMLQIIAQGNEEQDMDLYIRPDARDEVESTINRIIRYSRTDQLAEEMCQTEQPLPNSPAPREEHMNAMEKQIMYLTNEVQQIKQQLTQPTVSLIWPTYQPNATEEDKHSFENYLRTLCTSGRRSATSDIKTYLSKKEEAGLILRPKQQNTEWEILKRFGYPYTNKTYYNS